MKKIAISQSNYLPWKGFFDLINQVDTFVIYDEMQFTKNDWRNRNQIKTERGLKWITIPVLQKGRFGQKINEVLTTDNSWRMSHWSSIEQSYKEAEFFEEYNNKLKGVFLGDQSRNLSEVNFSFLKVICEILEIQTEFIFSRDLNLNGDRVERVIGICEQLRASTYVSSITAKNYMTEKPFQDVGIEVKWLKFEGYPVYQQLYDDFIHHVSIIDLIFNLGPRAKNFIVSEQ